MQGKGVIIWDVVLQIISLLPLLAVSLHFYPYWNRAEAGQDHQKLPESTSRLESHLERAAHAIIIVCALP